MLKVIGTQDSTIEYIDRHAVRLILINTHNQIVIIHARKDDYYRLPGGGIEDDEDHAVAAVREAKEETGCIIKVDGECMATTEEWRNGLHQVSYCYLAHLITDTGSTELTADELEDGLVHEWVGCDTAIEKMSACHPTSELGKFIKERDLFFVETYSKKREVL